MEKSSTFPLLLVPLEDRNPGKTGLMIWVEDLPKRLPCDRMVSEWDVQVLPCGREIRV